MSSAIVSDGQYKEWLVAVKTKVRTAQLKAIVKVNTELLTLYWELGAEIVAKQASAKWGDGFLPLLSHDLTAEFPEMKGFSVRNLKYIRQWYLFYTLGGKLAADPMGQQAVAPLQNSLAGQQPIAPSLLQSITQIPWGHNIAIITKCNGIEEASLSQNTPVSSISTLKLSIVNCVVNMMNRALVFSFVRRKISWSQNMP
jgi:DUF1016 N-terminal domain